MDLALAVHRLQFAFTITFHYIFPQLTMGLALLIVVLKTMALRTGNERYDECALFNPWILWQYSHNMCAATLLSGSRSRLRRWKGFSRRRPARRLWCSAVFLYLRFSGPIAES